MPLLLPLFFSLCQLFYLKNAIALFSEWSFREFVGIILFTIFIFIFSLLELTTTTILKLIALTIGGFITSYQALRLNSIGLWIDLLEIACNLSVKILDYKIFVTLGLWKCISRILWLLCLLYLSCEVWIDALGDKENLKFSKC